MPSTQTVVFKRKTSTFKLLSALVWTGAVIQEKRAAAGVIIVMFMILVLSLASDAEWTDNQELKNVIVAPSISGKQQDRERARRVLRPMKGYTAKVGLRKPQPSSGLIQVIGGAFMQWAPRQKFPEPTPDFDPEVALEASRRYLEQYGWWRV